MAIKNIDARIKNKRDTATNWEKNNPVLLNGEIIIVDTSSGEVRTKTGDGIKNYKQLPFDDEAIKAQITSLSNSIPDVSKYVIAEDAGGIVDTVPETFGGHTVSDFVLKTDVVNNIDSDATDAPLSAKQGKELNGRIDDMSALLSTTSNQVSQKLSQSGGTMTDSDATDAPLSAKQGKELNGRIDDMSALLSTTSNQVSQKLSQSGGTMTGALVAQTNTNYDTRQVRNVIISTAAPTASNGSNGDIWVRYKA